MQRSVCIGRICIESLANQKNRFAMRVTPGFRPVDVRCQRDVARHLFPHKMKRVGGRPHVLAATRDEVGFLSQIVVHSSRLADRAYVSVFVEKPQRRVLDRSGSKAMHKDKKDQLNSQQTFHVEFGALCPHPRV